MKIFGRLSGIALLLGAVVTFSGCADPEPGKGGTIPPAWEEPGAPRVGGRAAWDSGDDQPSAWGQGANEGALDERTGVRRVEVAGFPMFHRMDLALRHRQ